MDRTLGQPLTANEIDPSRRYQMQHASTRSKGSRPVPSASTTGVAGLRTPPVSRFSTLRHQKYDLFQSGWKGESVVTPKLWLIGMMSSGKTKVGKKVSRLSGHPLVDTDDEIVERAGMSIPDIFATRGEPVFRTMESEEVARIAGGPHRMVIATGGGVILDETNRRLMRETGLVVLLKPSLDALIARGKTRNRPLLQGHADLGARYTEIWETRKHLYREASHADVPTDGKPRSLVAKEVWELWQSS